MNYDNLVSGLVTATRLIAVGVPALQTVLTAEAMIRGLVSAVKDKDLPLKQDGTPYTHEDVSKADRKSVV